MMLSGLLAFAWGIRMRGTEHCVSMLYSREWGDSLPETVGILAVVGLLWLAFAPTVL